MRMSSPEKLILENQLKIMGALSILLRNIPPGSWGSPGGETTAAQDLSRQCSITSTVLHGAKTWPA